MITTDRTTLRFVTQATEAAGGTLPEAVAAAITTAERTQNEGLSMPKVEDILEAVLDALEAGKAPAEDRTVVRLVSGRALATQISADAVKARAWARAVRVCAAEAGTVIDSWQPGFTDAAATLSAARTVIGDEPIDDHESILRRGGKAAEQYVKVVDAEKTITTIVTGWTALAKASRVNVVPDSPTRLTALSHDELVSHELRGHVRPWDIVRAGLALSLPTFAEYRRRNEAMAPPAVPTFAESNRQTQRREGAGMREAQAANHGRKALPA